MDQPQPAASHGSQPGCSSVADRDPRWFVVKSDPQCERLAAYELARRGFTAFLPMVTERRPMRPRELLSRKMRRETPTTKLVDVPFFPGYLFVEFCRATDDWPRIVHTEGVQRLMCGMHYRPTPVRRGVVEALQASVDERQKITALPSLAGVDMTVIKGPFADEQGVCLWSGADRVKLLIGGMVVDMRRDAVRV